MICRMVKEIVKQIAKLIELVGAGSLVQGAGQEEQGGGAEAVRDHLHVDAVERRGSDGHVKTAQVRRRCRRG